MLPLRTVGGIMAKTISRKELYNLVWSKPMTKAAADFGISDVGLRKVCVRNLIPTPPLGYWAKKQAGYDVHQPELPVATDKKTEQITIYGFESTLPEEVIQVMETARQKVQARTLIPLSSPEGELHPAIRATAKVLRKAKPSDNVIYASNSNHCGIEVGVASVERTIVILDAIAHGLNQQGLALEPAGTKMRVSKGPDELTFNFIERVETQKHIPTPEEVTKEEKRLAKRERDIRLGNWNYDNNTKAYPEFDYIRTGELGIQIADQYVRGARRSWKDGKTQKVEDLIDEIAVGIVAYLEGVKARREEHERWQREWKEREQRRALAKKHQEREGRRREFVLKIAEKVAEIDKLEKFLQIQAYGPADTADEFTRLLEWVQSRVASLKMGLSREKLLSSLQKNKLFPEDDPLIWIFEEAEEDREFEYDAL